MMSELTRRESESDFEYHKRLLIGKLVDKTLRDVEYSDIASMLYGQKYANDVARRMMYGSKRTIDMVEKYISEHNTEWNSNVDELKEIERRTSEMIMERRKLFDQRREMNKIYSVAARADNLYSVIKDAASLVNESLPLIDVNADDIDDHAYNDAHNDALIVFSDWHYGMTTDNVWNRYDTDICVARVNESVKNIIERIKLHKCDNATVVVLGDLVHGSIHTSARVASEELVCDQLMHVSEILANSIYEISKSVSGKTRVLVTYGNHARVVPNKEDSIHKDNFERIVPWWLKERFSSNNSVDVEFDDSNEFLLFDICGHSFVASHGDLDNVKSSALLHTLFSKKLGRDIEYVIVGDKHHDERFEELGITSTICGSLCGVDDYANDRRLFSTPYQLMMIVNEKYGVDAEYKIRVE